MRKIVIAVALLVFMGLVLSCAPSYKFGLKEQTETDNVTPITLDEASQVQGDETVVTFVIRNNGISSDSVVNIGNFHKGAQADVVYLVRNESSASIVPVIYYGKDTHIDNYSQVEGQGYKDAPSYVENWVTISPNPIPIQPKLAQGYIVSLVMPDDDIEGLPKKFAFQVGVAVGDRVQLAASPWWLVQMR